MRQRVEAGNWELVIGKFKNYIVFFSWALFSSNVFFGQVKPINVLLIVSFLTLKSLWLPAENFFRNRCVVANHCSTGTLYPLSLPFYYIYIFIISYSRARYMRDYRDSGNGSPKVKNIFATLSRPRKNRGRLSLL